MRGRSGKLVGLLGLITALGLTAAGLAGCGSTVSEVELGENDEFIFTGSMQGTNGRTFNLRVTGDKTDNSLRMTVDEMPAMSLTGTYEKVEGKGYKVYFNDMAESFAYTQYDTETKNQTFKTIVNMGNYGTEKVEFTYHDETFAEEYDGIGLGKTPPTFDIEGIYGGGHLTTGTLHCLEDGTIKIDTGICQPRMGTWEYDEDANVYTITFTEKTFDIDGVEEWKWKQYPYDAEAEVPVLSPADLEAQNYFMGPVQTEYNEETGEYSMEIELLWSTGKWNEISEFGCVYSE